MAFSLQQQFLNDVSFGTFLEKNKKEIIRGLADLYGVQTRNAGAMDVAGVEAQSKLDVADKENRMRQELMDKQIKGGLEEAKVKVSGQKAVAGIEAGAHVKAAGITAGPHNAAIQLTREGQTKQETLFSKLFPDKSLSNPSVTSGVTPFTDSTLHPLGDYGFNAKDWRSGKRKSSISTSILDEEEE